MEFGVDWNFMAGMSLSGTAATEDIITSTQFQRGTGPTMPIANINARPGTPIETFGFANAGGDGLRLGIAAGNMRAFITALESTTDMTILANPKILTVNKQEGSVLIGTNLGYRSSTTVSTGGVATEGEVEFLQTGTQLVFRPYIGNDGYIRMDIYPKDSDASLNEDGVPTENTTELRSNIIVKDGETIVIGGLFRDVVIATRNQLPILGNFPIVGALFRGTTDVVQRQEVIVLLTVRIIEDPSETDGDGRAEDVRRKRFGAKDTLHSIGRARWAEDAYAEAAQYYVEGNTCDAMRRVRVALILRPTYLEAIRLKERILAETDPDEAAKLERIVLEDIDLQQAPNWLRR
jgi:type II secretory pathway component GspD/PulD (secretin)